MKWIPKLTPLFIALPLLYVAFLVYRNNVFAPYPITDDDAGIEQDYSSPPTREQLLDGLLAPDHFKVASCLSRYQSALYRKSSPHKPSSYLLSKLRDYEKLHSSCGPNTNSYNSSIKQLMSGTSAQALHHSNSNATETDPECKYVVWVAVAGLGNRILSITSAFLYALLTNRVLLINEDPDMAYLFCQPFPNTTWLLPRDFPVSFKYQLYWFTKNYGRSYGKMLKTNKINIASTNKLLLPPYLYLYLVSDYDHHDKLFFCDEHQTILSQVPWLIVKSNVYFLPSLFLMPSFQDELNKLFPDKETVFHHLGRYLFHPSNQVWRLITTYYKQYLANAQERIGIQIRIFNHKTSPFRCVMDQILSCVYKEKLLPQVDMDTDTDRTIASPALSGSGQNVSKAVLITSLYPDYFKKMNNMYSRHPTSTREVIAVYQPSHESKQQSKNNLHNKKAWAEIYLLSITDVLVTSAWSTFGYVAYGLAGKKPWFLYKIEQKTIPDPACGRALSMEPCFHSPPVYDCKAKSEVDTATLVPHLRHCEDIPWGTKLFNISQ